MNPVTDQFDLLLVGFDPVLLGLVEPALQGMRLKHLKDEAEFEDFLVNYKLSPGTTVFISADLKGLGHFEVGQSLSSYFKNLHLIFMTMDRSKFDVQNLTKNGFTETFLWPMDKTAFNACAESLKSKILGGITKRYRAVKLMDLQPGQELPFQISIYMPLNKRYVVLSGSGSISDVKFENLKKQGVSTVYIEAGEIEKFYAFATEQLVNLGVAADMATPETQKAERFQKIVRELFKSIWDSGGSNSDFEAGRDLLEQSKKVVENYVIQKTGFESHQKLRLLLGDGTDSYSHAQIVSTLAGLMSMGTGIGQPEDLALAGLFHDVGNLGQNDEISVLTMDRLDEEALKIFKAHPTTSVNLLKEKKITLTPVIAEIIEKHHERVDGKGFPNALPKHKIPYEAQLLSYADAFEYLTRRQEAGAATDPLKVHDMISEKFSFDPDLLAKVQRFLKAS